MNKRFLALDGVRGYAAFVVLVYHSILIYDESLITSVLNSPIQKIPGIYEKLVKFALFIFDGRIAVMFFFMLSGIVLSLAVRRSVLSNPFLVSCEFALKRIARIYPTMIVSLVLFFAARVFLHQYYDPKIFPLFPLKNLLDNIIFINPVLNGSTWTLNVEILAIPFILLVFAIQKKFGLKGLAVIFLITVFCLDSSNLRNLALIPASLFPNFQNLIYFVCGFFIASEQAKPFFVAAGKDARFVVIISTLFFIPIIGSRFAVSGIILQTVSILVLLGALYYREVPWLLRILESRPSVYLGKISFSFYLNGSIFLYILFPVFAAYFPTKQHPLEFGLLTAIIAAVPTIMLSHITEKIIEQPSIRLGKLITSFFAFVERKFLVRQSLPISVVGAVADDELPTAKMNTKDVR